MYRCVPAVHRQQLPPLAACVPTVPVYTLHICIAAAAGWLLLLRLQQQNFSRSVAVLWWLFTSLAALQLYTGSSISTGRLHMGQPLAWWSYSWLQEEHRHCSSSRCARKAAA
jgi:hypothetical protein